MKKKTKNKFIALLAGIVCVCVLAGYVFLSYQASARGVTYSVTVVPREQRSAVGQPRVQRSFGMEQIVKPNGETASRNVITKHEHSFWGLFQVTRQSKQHPA